MGVWSDFLEWSREKGLPFGDWADALEAKGIPSWTVLILAVLALAGTVFLLQAALKPLPGTVSVTVVSMDGRPLPGVNVSLSGNGTAYGVTGSDGALSLEVLPGEYYGAVSGPERIVLIPQSFNVVVSSKKTERVSIRFSEAYSSKVDLSVTVSGPSTAKIILANADGSELDSSDGLSAVFQLEPSSGVVVTVKADGFGSQSKPVTMGKSGQSLSFSMLKLGVEAKSKVRVKVFDGSSVNTPLEGASVRLFEGEKLLSSDKSLSDGSVRPFDVKRGSVLRVVGEAPGFAPAEVHANASAEEVPVELSLLKAVAGVLVGVKDEEGNSIVNPLVRMHSASGVILEATPFNGVAEFNSSGEYATVYKPGFLPALVKPVAKENKVVLKKALKTNSGSLDVQVYHFNGVEAGGASVWLVDGLDPLGIPARITGSDGTQKLSDLPKKELTVNAQLGGRKASKSVLIAENTSVVLYLPRADVETAITVKDALSGRPVPGASVQLFAGSNASCSTNAKGVCTLKVLESPSAMAVVSSGSFKQLESAELLVSPSSNVFAFELVPSSVSSGLKFVGLFDENGEKVSFIKPASFYTAKYVLSIPQQASGAEAVVSVGEASSIASIASFDAAGGSGSLSTASSQEKVVELGSNGLSGQSVDVEQGGRVVWKNGRNASAALSAPGFSSTLGAGESHAFVFSTTGTTTYSFGGFSGSVVVREALKQPESKTVRFSFPAFSGAREISVKIKIDEASQGKLEIQQRASFFGKKTFSEPEGGAFKASGSFPVKFSGSCENNACLSFQSAVQAELGKEATLAFELLSLEQGPFKVVLEPSSGIQVIDQGVGSRGQSMATEILLPSAGNAFAVIKPTRLTKDAYVKVSASSSNRPLVASTQSIAVTSQGTPKLKVEVKPSSIDALAQGKLSFVVKDEFGGIVEDARVSLKAGEVSAEATTASKPGVFEAEFEPASLGFVDYTVEATGFAKFAGKIKVNPPDSIVEVSPSTLAFSVESKERSKAGFSVTSKVTSPVSVSLTVALDGVAKYTDFRASPTLLRLKAKESKQAELSAAIKQTVLSVAQKASVLKEKVSGTVMITASSAGSSTQLPVRFTVDSSFDRQSLDGLWELGSSSLQFQLEPPRKESEAQEVRVKNNADLPIMVNQENTLPEAVSMSPLSITVPANGEGVFKARGRLPREFNCFSEDLQRTGTVTFIASAQGVSSRKVAQTSVGVSSTSTSCAPVNGMRVVLPVDLSLALPPGTRTKANPDGSNAVLLPSSEIMVLGSGSTASGIEAIVPLNTQIDLPRQYAVQAGGGGWTISFPFAARLTITEEAEVQQSPGGIRTIALRNALIRLPPSAILPTLANAAAGQQPRVAQVPPMAPVTFTRLPFNNQAYNNLLPANAVQLKLSADALFKLPLGSTVRTPQQASQAYSPRTPYLDVLATENLQGVQGVSLPNGERLAFSSDASVTAQQASLPRAGSLFISKYYVEEVAGYSLKDAFKLKTPADYTLSFSGSTAPYKDSSGAWTVKLDEGFIQFTFKPDAGKAEVKAWDQVTYIKDVNAKDAVDPTAVSACKISFKPGRPSVLILPESAVAGEGFKYTFPTCGENSRVKITDEQSKELVESPALKYVEVEGPEKPDAVDVRAGIPLTASSVVRLTPCLKDDSGQALAEDVRSLVASIDGSTTLEVPQSLKNDEVPSEIRLNGYKQVKITGSVSLVGQTDKIRILDAGQLPRVEKNQNSKNVLVLGAGSRISFIPYCDKTTSADFAVSSSNNPLELSNPSGVVKLKFTNADILKQQEVEIDVFNRGGEPIKVTGSEAASSAKEFAAFFPEGKRGFKEAFGKPEQSVISPINPGVANKFVFAVEVPDVVLEQKGVGKCFKKEYEGKKLYGYLSLKATANDVPLQDTGMQKVQVEISIEPGECKPEKTAGSAAEFLTHSVPESREEHVQRLTFKNPGTYRYISVINNHEGKISFKVEGNGLEYVKCVNYNKKELSELEKEGTLEPGETRLLKCTALKKTTGGQEIKFSFFNGANKLEGRTVNPVVYSSHTGVYAASPLGRVSRGEKEPKYAYCKYNYCTYDQALAAVKDFTKQFASVVNQKIELEGSETAALSAFQAQVAGGAYKKSTVIELANTLVSDKTSAGFAEVLETVGKDNSYASAKLSDFKLSGCGVYRYTLALNPFPGTFKTPDEAKKSFQIEGHIEKLADCESTLANAAILTAEEPQLIPGKKPARTAWEGLRHPIDSVSLTFGPVFSAMKAAYSTGLMSGWSELKKARVDIAAYSSIEDEKDVKNLDKMQKILYEKQFDKKSEAAYYDDTSFCVSKGMPIALKKGLPMLGALLAGKWFFTAGLTAYSDMLAAATGSTTAVCGYGIAKSGYTCEGINTCITALAIGGMNTLTNVVPGGNLAWTFIKRFVTDLALTAGIDAGLSYFDYWGYKDVSVGVPYAIQRGLTGASSEVDARLSHGLSREEARFLAALARNPAATAETAELYNIMRVDLGAAAGTATTVNTWADAIAARTTADAAVVTQLPAEVRNLMPGTAAAAAGATQEGNLLRVLRQLNRNELRGVLTSVRTDLAGLPLASIARDVNDLESFVRTGLPPTHAPGITNLEQAFGFVGGPGRRGIVAPPGFLSSVAGAVPHTPMTATVLEPLYADRLRTFLNGISTRTGVPSARMVSLLRDNTALRRVFPNIGRTIGAAEAVAVPGAPGARPGLLLPPAPPTPAGRFASFFGEADYGRVLRGAGRFGVNLVVFSTAFMMFNIDVRPVRAEVSPESVSAVVVANTKGELPSLQSACFNAGEECISEKKFTCKGAACVYLLKGGVANGLQQHAFVAVVNDDVKAEKLVKSVVDPDEPPLADSELAGVVAAPNSVELPEVKTP